NIEVDDFHTYHVGRLGVWVHNADCCDFGNRYGNATEILTKGGWVDAKTSKVMYLDPFTNTKKFFPDDAVVSFDHILPRAEFKKIPGFNNLPKDVQEKLINDPSNLQPLPKHLNSSKGSKIETGTDGWVKYVAGNQAISPGYRTYLKEHQDRIRAIVRKEIQKKR
ncbi:hypothetical protein, partial [Moraxella sp.]|uniref:hypothetical protein n=1 Tax=Moraxella sp. TaxID=479 RepID=UPI0026DD602C